MSRLIDADELLKAIANSGMIWETNECLDVIEVLTVKKIIDDAPTVEPKELQEVRNICEHWNDNSSSFVSACNAFEDILHIFKLGVGDTRGDV